MNIWDKQRVTIIDADTGDDIPLKTARVKYSDSEGILITLVTWPDEAEDYVCGKRRCDIRIDDDRTNTYMPYHDVVFHLPDVIFTRYVERSNRAVLRAAPYTLNVIRFYALIKLV